MRSTASPGTTAAVADAISEPTRPAVVRLPVAPGVYRFRDARGRALYIGRATDLRHRVASYWSDLGDRQHLVRMVPQIQRVEAIACDSPHEAAWLERNLLEASKPQWNRVRGGMEVPVWLRLDLSPRRPGLTVVHLAEPHGRLRHFGPYLGGNQARLAIAALDRILPLAYAGAGVRGSAADMARKRHVSKTDLEWMLAATVAILERHPDAVARARAALAGLRDDAAARLRFELAAQIQAESDAIDWITGPQRMTSPEAAPFDIFGWADGILVHWAMREGRISSWTQRAEPEAEARARVAATPVAWREFARRNAELAAALAGGS
jgi:excinuclease ABC subunit C